MVGRAFPGGAKYQNRAKQIAEHEMRSRILILESINDKLSRDRAEILAHAPWLKEFTIDHCYAVSPTEEDLEEATKFLGPRIMAELSVWESQGSPVDYQDFLRMLEEKISEFQPDIVLLHTGVAFHRHSELFLKALTEVKKRHPQLKLGYQYRPSDAYLDELPLFDRDETTKSIEREVFLLAG